MPTFKFDSIEDVYKSLTDLEIEDDSKKDGIPGAEIKVKGLHTIKIKMVSSWDHHNILEPMKNKMLAFYAQSIVKSTSSEDLERATEKTRTIVNEITGLSLLEIREKTDKLSYFFEDEKIRHEFFKGLRKMRILKWWVTFKRWEKSVCLHHTLTVFIMLWAFNFDGLKKKTLNCLKAVNMIYASINSQSPTSSSNFTDFDTFKKAHEEAHQRVVEKSLANSNN